MRKDTFLGMTIGGGLIAVIAVGVVSISHKGKGFKGQQGATILANDKNPDSEDVTPQQSDDSKDSSAQPKVNEIKPPAAPAKKVLETMMVRNEPKRDPIADLLQNGSGSATVSETPGTTGGVDVDPPKPQPIPDAPAPVDTKRPNSAAPANPPATQPTGNTAVAKAHTHTVQKGETFSTIAAAAYGSANYYPYIMRANPKIDAKHLKPNMVINLPDASEVKPPEKPAVAADTKSEANLIAHKTDAVINSKTEYRVVAGDSLHKIAIKLYGKIDMVDKIYDTNKDVIGPNKAALKVGTVLKLPQAPVVATAQ